MYHDGDNGCDISCCIMSPSLGNGKTRWSRCSANEFEQFFNNLGSNDFPPQCLLETPPISASSSIDPPLDLRVLPGQRYNLDQQCRIFHGDCWHHELKDGQTPEDVCSMVWCGEDEGLIRTAHPALEGTYCSPGM
uniref:ADAMTS cysteine-rich domain-containing protein n=1 Tax=Romanomermis culicivorax TaxID=13658 RepID=A0A915KPD1_ROMCU